MLSELQKHANEFLLNGNEIGIMLIHGVTGIPEEMRLLGEYLNKKGATVYGVRVAGHGTTPEELAKLKWKDLYKSVEEKLEILKEKSTTLVVGGLSMGGMLTLALAAEHKEIQKIFTLSAPVELNDWRIKLIPLLKIFMKYYKKEPEDEINGLPHYSYPVYPLSTIYELYKAQKQIKQNLPKITQPILIIHSKSDPSVDVKNAQIIYDNVSAKEKKIVLLEKSGHVITKDVEKEKVFEAVADFIFA